MIKRFALSYIENLKQVISELDFSELERIIDELLKARNQRRRIFIMGNGGSAATATHFICDLNKGTIDFSNENFLRFKAMALSDNLSIITAIGNDISYDDIFIEQLKNFLSRDDIVIGISASGNSPNIVKALQYAKSNGAITIGFLGFSGGKAQKLVDYSIVFKSYNYGIVEDGHLILVHMITQIINKILKSQKERVVFLDRDGIINKKPGPHQYVTKWEDFEFVDGIFETLKGLNAKGYRLVVVTNQQGIGKGLFTDKELREIHSNMLEQLKGNGIEIDKIYYCPHLESDNCLCRKPRPGMFYKAINELPYTIDIPNSFILGDSINDIIAGNSVGLKTILYSKNGNAQDHEFIQYKINKLSDVLKVV